MCVVVIPSHFTYILKYFMDSKSSQNLESKHYLRNQNTSGMTRPICKLKDSEIVKQQQSVKEQLR